MNKIKTTLSMALAFALALFSNCRSYVPTGHPEYYVKEKTNDKTGHSEYEIRPTHGNGYISHTDTITAFNINDTLIFRKK